VMSTLIRLTSPGPHEKLELEVAAFWPPNM
jgi:hypothetical protein